MLSILMVTPEMVPYAKVGGLADVLGALPKELAKRGHDVRVVLPLYGCISRDASWQAVGGPLIVNFGPTHKAYARVWETRLPAAPGSTAAVTVYGLEHEVYFGRHDVYAGFQGDFPDNGARFSFLSKASLDLCHHLQWYPQLIHCHDWTTGLVPVYLNTLERHSRLGRSATVMTIHNLEHQGIFPASLLDFTGLPASVFTPDGLEAMGHLNMLKGGLYHATKLTTVSPHYAREIQTRELGCGLDGLLRFRAADLIGILNGIDTEHWNPHADPYLPAHYRPGDHAAMAGKAECKRLAQERFRLEVNPHVPLFSTVSRLYPQKGLDMLAEVFHDWMRTMQVQVLVLGSGQSDLEHLFAYFGRSYPGRVGVHIGYHAQVAHWIKAASDFFIMPSRFEPCGLAQLYAMVYGALPIVRATGGLVDTVQPYDEATGQGTGFVFGEATPRALYDTLGWACSTYYDRPQHFSTMQQRAMRQDFSWEPSVQRYLDVYGWAIEARGKGV